MIGQNCLVVNSDFMDKLIQIRMAQLPNVNENWKNISPYIKERSTLFDAVGRQILNSMAAASGEKILGDQFCVSHLESWELVQLCCIISDFYFHFMLEDSAAAMIFEKHLDKIQYELNYFCHREASIAKKCLETLTCVNTPKSDAHFESPILTKVIAVMRGRLADRLQVEKWQPYDEIAAPYSIAIDIQELKAKIFEYVSKSDLDNSVLSAFCLVDKAWQRCFMPLLRRNLDFVAIKFSDESSDSCEGSDDGSGSMGRYV